MNGIETIYVAFGIENPICFRCLAKRFCLENFGFFETWVTWRPGWRHARGSSGPDSNTIVSRQLPGSRKKKLAPNDPVAPKYIRLRETNFYEKVSFFFQSWTLQNLALCEYNLEVRGCLPTKSKPYCCPSICTMRFCACLRVVIERRLSSGGFRSALSAVETSCVFWP